MTSSLDASADAPPAGFAADLVEPGRLVICSAFPRRLFAEFDAQGNPFGVDIDIGLAVARELGLEPIVRDFIFDDLIDAVVDGECDVAISGHFITQQRLERVDLIAYREGSVSPVVGAGNPLGIETITDLCGRTVSIVEGTVYRDIIRGLGEYGGRGIDQQCEQAGEPPTALAESATEADAVALLVAGDADAYIGNEAVAAERSSELDLSPAQLPRLRNGIAHRLGSTELDEALRTALRALIADGTYAAIFERYGVGPIGVTELP